jgi:hypothetical protein
MLIGKQDEVRGGSSHLLLSIQFGTQERITVNFVFPMAFK